MRILGIVQARMGSNRLPGKVLMPMAGAPMLQRLVERAQAAKRLDRLVVATTEFERDDPVVALCEARAIPVYRGEEDDILGRFMKVVAAERPDLVVRLTGDNPLVGGDLIDYAINAYLAMNPRPDYLNTVDDGTYPSGLTLELITTKALKKCAESDDPLDREHVTWFVRQRPESFHCVFLEAPTSFSPMPLTVDTQEEYDRVRDLFEHLFARNPSFGTEEIRMEGLSRYANVPPAAGSH
jgi:spore coat polysaccharide biosynthesis protein SpsF